jgi:hypothetical protein
VSSKFLAKEKFEYLSHILIKWTDIFTSDRGLFIVHIPTRDVVKHYFEVFTSDFTNELNRSLAMKKTTDLFP